jgi:hypothetical protein
MGKKKKFAYCSNCEKEIFKAKRKSIDSMYYNVWIVSIISSLGLALIPFIIYRYGILKKNLCPICKNKLDFYSSREKIPEPKAQITRILQTIEQEKKEKDINKMCPYCQEEISRLVEICPNCGSILKEEK